ncbi:methyltransferase-like protein 27 [Anoplopoma fimbria]|uniref:methyltransferase-like protein 27 n=1 Tax=Anoplopoma fimbria TaxID=229290 RepID=UPI0023EC76BF|nr:methyltransferase-like protein 27 [Anoplopoma fimbria]
MNQSPASLIPLLLYLDSLFTHRQVSGRVLTMSEECSRTVDDLRTLLKSSDGFNSQQRMKFYDSWAETYEQDLQMVNFRAPNLGVDLLNANFSGNREEVQVLDVACGSGLVTKLMVELGFKHFVGVDGSQGMLDQAAKTGLYKELKLALLGTEPLPAQTGTFDVVIIVGALDTGFVPVSVVRELCHAAKPGGFVCISRGDHRGTAGTEYKKDLERVLQLMEEEGLWSPVGLKQTDRYMEDLDLNPEEVQELQQEERYIRGTGYLYKKAIHSNKLSN